MGSSLHAVVKIIILLGSGYVFLKLLSVIPTRKSPFSKNIMECNNRRFLGVCIILLVFVPGHFVADIFSHPLPEGEYTIDVEYSINSGWYNYHGTAPLTVDVTETIWAEEKESTGWWVQPSYRTYSDTYFTATSIKLDCFDNTVFDLSHDINSNDRDELEITYRNHTYFCYIQIDDLSDETLHYTIEDRIDDVKPRTIVWHSSLWLISIIGIVFYFLANYYNEYGFWPSFFWHRKYIDVPYSKYN